MGKYAALATFLLLLEVGLTDIVKPALGNLDVKSNSYSSISSSTNSISQQQNQATESQQINHLAKQHEEVPQHDQIQATVSHSNLHLINSKKANLHHQNLNKLQKFLNEKQRTLIERHPGSLMAVARALKMAVLECQYQMRHDLWDCPVYGFSIRPADVFGKVMLQSFRETSFIHSLLSSALAHSVARACTEQIILTCPGREPIPTSGVHKDNLEFGHYFAQKFMEATNELSVTPETIAASLLSPTSSASSSSPDNNNIIPTGRGLASDDSSMPAQLDTNNSITNNNVLIQATVSNYEQELQQQQQLEKLARDIKIRNLINAHNDELGRLLVFHGVKETCKCHGVSGACTMHICWRDLPPFRDVATKIHERWKSALRVLPKAYTLIPSRQKSLTSDSIKKSNKKRSSPMNRLSRSSSSSISPKPSYYHNSPEINSHQPLARSISRGNFSAPIGRSRGAKRHTDLDNCENCYRLPAGGADLVFSDSFLRSPVQDTSATNKSDSSEGAADLMILNQHTMKGNTTTPVKRRPVARSIATTTPHATARRTPTKDDLLYYEESPDFCVPNEIYNIKGTKGRICSEKSETSNNCKTLCCGRGYKREVREEKYKCECQFKFCCKLECNTCTRRKFVHKCL